MSPPSHPSSRRLRHPAFSIVLWRAFLLTLIVFVAIEVRAVARFSVAGPTAPHLTSCVSSCSDTKALT